MRHHGNAWNPFDQLESMFEQLTIRGPRPDNWGATPSHRPIAVDVTEDEDAIHVTADLPGVSKEDIDLALTDRTLTISVTTTDAGDDEEETFIHRERRHTNVERRISLPTPVDTDATEAKYVNGVLSVTLPKADADSGTTIDIE